jgi:hypothetical protein
MRSICLPLFRLSFGALLITYLSMFTSDQAASRPLNKRLFVVAGLATRSAEHMIEMHICKRLLPTFKALDAPLNERSAFFRWQKKRALVRLEFLIEIEGEGSVCRSLLADRVRRRDGLATSTTAQS